MKPASMRRETAVRAYFTEKEARDIARMARDFGHCGSISSEIHSIALKALSEWKKEKTIEQFDLFK